MVEKTDKMNIKEESFDDPSLIKKILIWIIVISISLMLILTILFQPKFFTFVP
jgi:hypothetical protein